MLKRLSNAIVWVELLTLAFGGVVMLFLLTFIGPPPENDFTLLSKVQHVLAFLSLLPIAYLCIAYIRSDSSEFILEWDAPWIFAYTVAACVLAVAILGIVGLNERDGPRDIDLFTCVVAVPLGHLSVLGLLGRRLTIGSSDRGVTSSLSQGGDR
jgi:hypothetical protein